MGSSLVRLPFKLAQIHTLEPAGAFITHCHAADCTQGFPSTLCKCTVEDKRQNVTLLEEVGALGLDSDTGFFPTAPVQCLVEAATGHTSLAVLFFLWFFFIATDPCYAFVEVLSAVCWKLLDQKLFVGPRATNCLNLWSDCDRCAISISCIHGLPDRWNNKMWRAFWGAGGCGFYFSKAEEKREGFFLNVSVSARLL